MTPTPHPPLVCWLALVIVSKLKCVKTMTCLAVTVFTNFVTYGFSVQMFCLFPSAEHIILKLTINTGQLFNSLLVCIPTQNMVFLKSRRHEKGSVVLSGYHCTESVQGWRIISNKNNKSSNSYFDCRLTQKSRVTLLKLNETMLKSFQSTIHYLIKLGKKHWDLRIGFYCDSVRVMKVVATAWNLHPTD